MRRDVFQVMDKDKVEAVLGECEYGTLSLIVDDEPYGVAVNFVFFEDMLCFHGAKEGRKVEAIKNNSKASFLAVKPYSMIPSYFSKTRSACPATQFYASVHMYGDIKIIENGDKKAKILGALMQKLQSEGGYDEIEADNPMYTKMLERTDVYMLNPKTTSCKIKFAQNRSPEQMQSLIEQLRERGTKLDMDTISLIKSFSHKT